MSYVPSESHFHHIREDLAEMVSRAIQTTQPDLAPFVSRIGDCVVIDYTDARVFIRVETQVKQTDVQKDELV